MHRIAAELRHRELTQEIYNIGDEVAQYIEHLIESITDYDAELTIDCLAEFDEIIADARTDSRRIITELIGLRQALTSGVRAGVLSASATQQIRALEPELLDGLGLRELAPIHSFPLEVTEIAEALEERTQLVLDHLQEIVDCVLNHTQLVAQNLTAVSLSQFFGRMEIIVTAAVEGWIETVADAHPGYVRAQRGMHPPQFLAERARVDAIVARVAARKASRIDAS